MAYSKCTLIFALTFGLLFVSLVSASQDGLEIVREMDRRDSGWKDFQVNQRMTLRAANGREVIREIRTRSLEVEGDGDRTLVIFDRPRDVQGTTFLTFSHKTGNDDQWLYLPALRRVKRIASSNRSGPFMGSEFAFEDVSSEEIERYTYRYIREDPCGENLECFVVERIPTDPGSGYSRQNVWIDKTHYRLQTIEYFDRKGLHLKTLQRHDYQQYPGGFWRASRWEMSNHQSGKTTLIEWQEYRFTTGLDYR